VISMDKDAPGTSIQDQYLTRARKDRWWLTVFLNSGKKIGGRVVGFDRYVVVLEDRGQEQMVFRYAEPGRCSRRGGHRNARRGDGRPDDFGKHGRSARIARRGMSTALVRGPDGC